MLLLCYGVYIRSWKSFCYFVVADRKGAIEIDKEEHQRIFREHKKYLIRYRIKKHLIERLEKKLMELDIDLQNIKSVEISDMPGGGIPTTLNDRYVRKEELEERINRLLIEARKLRTDIFLVLDQLDNAKEVDVLEQYFIDDLSIESIANQTNYSERQVTRLYVDGVVHCDISECQ